MKFFLTVATSLIFSLIANAWQTIDLYPPDKIPNSKQDPSVKETESIHNGNILILSHVVHPRLQVYAAPKETATGTAVIIFPGGSYTGVAAGHEGSDVAAELNKIGITAFVVIYRIPDPRIMTTPEIGPLQDAQRAIQLVREGAQIWHIDPARIGIMGFSAGGHLASSAGTRFTKALIDNPEGTSLRPDFLVLLYPVISSDPSFAHKASYSSLLGKNVSGEKLLEFSNEKNVSDQTPVTFLVHASDDETVPPENSIVFYKALLQHHVAGELHLYESGGHGFGLNNPTTTDRWMDRLHNWMAMNKF